jgi:ABC-type lipoprotein release transport system permease subunit
MSSALVVDSSRDAPVEPTDPVALGSAVALLSVVTLAACALPARRAMRTDPLVALRRD